MCVRRTEREDAGRSRWASKGVLCATDAAVHRRRRLRDAVSAEADFCLFLFFARDTVDIRTYSARGFCLQNGAGSAQPAKRIRTRGRDHLREASEHRCEREGREDYRARVAVVAE